MPKSVWARRVARKVLGERFAEWYRRRRAARSYLRAISTELLERERQLDKGESGMAERDALLERRIADVMDRTEILLQELDRRIEGLSARTVQRLSALENHAAELRHDIETLRRTVEALRSTAVPAPIGGAGDASAGAPSAVGE